MKKPINSGEEGLSKLQPAKGINISDPSIDPKTGDIEADIDEKVTPLGRKFNKRITLTAECIDDMDEENQELLPNEDDIQWSQGEWQIKVLKPFIDSISSQSYESEQVQIIKHLKLIIDKTYESINEYGWRVIILSLK